MDYHALQHKLFAMDPVDPAEDKRRMMAAAQSSAVAPTKDYVTESVNVPQGSMPLGIDSIADFAALAGINLNEKQKHGDYAKGSDPMPKAEPGRTKHPLKDKLVGEDDNTEQNPELDKLIQKYMQGFGMSEESARQLAQVAYMELVSKMPVVSNTNTTTSRMPVAPKSNFPTSRMPNAAQESTTESIKERLYAALKDYK
jgi:hypothetical protein